MMHCWVVMRFHERTRRWRPWKFAGITKAGARKAMAKSRRLVPDARFRVTKYVPVEMD